MITYLGAQALSGIIPGLSSAITQLQADAAQLTSMKADKQSALDQTTAQIAGINSVLSKATAVLNASQSLLNDALNVLNNSDTLTNNLANSLAAAGIHEYVWSGQVGQLGNDIAGQLGAGGLPGGTGATQLGNAIVIITTDGNAWASIARVLRIA